MIADEARLRAYQHAIAAVVRPGDAVAEIGCGPGVFALLACRAGAERVYAIDSEPIVGLARQLAETNHFSDRIKFIHGDSRKVELPERVHVIISDIRGVLPFFGHAIPVIEDARKRFLLKGGALLPSRDVLQAAVIEAPLHYNGITSPWNNSIAGLNLSPPLTFALNQERYHLYFDSDQLLTPPQSWHVLDYDQGASTNVAAELTFKAARSGIAHGVCVWFEAVLPGGYGYSTGPGSPTSGISGQVFFPWLQPVTLAKGQEIKVTLQADLVGNDYIWRWETDINDGADQSHHFRQSTLYAANFTPEVLRRCAGDFIPSLSQEGQVNRWMLQAIDGNTSLQEIAQAAAKKFPQIFPRWEDALHRAAELATQFSR